MHKEQKSAQNCIAAQTILLARDHFIHTQKNLGLGFNKTPQKNKNGYETKSLYLKSNIFGYETQSKTQIVFIFFAFFELLNVFSF